MYFYLLTGYVTLWWRISVMWVINGRSIEFHLFLSLYFFEGKKNSLSYLFLECYFSRLAGIYIGWAPQWILLGGMFWIWTALKSDGIRHKIHSIWLYYFVHLFYFLRRRFLWSWSSLQFYRSLLPCQCLKTNETVEILQLYHLKMDLLDLIWKSSTVLTKKKKHKLGCYRNYEMQVYI